MGFCAARVRIDASPSHSRHNAQFLGNFIQRSAFWQPLKGINYGLLVRHDQGYVVKMPVASGRFKSASMLVHAVAIRLKLQTEGGAGGFSGDYPAGWLQAFQSALSDGEGNAC
jgi:hypothetical protein